MIRNHFPGSFSTMPLPTRAFLASIVFAAASFGPTAPAAAAEKARAATAVTPPEQRVLSPAQLKDCNDQEARVQSLTDAALKLKAEIAAEKVEIDRTGTAITDDLATLDRTSADAVDAHNAKAEMRDKRIDAYQARVAAFNTDADGLQERRAAYVKACDRRRYDERDLPTQPKKKK